MVTIRCPECGTINTSEDVGYPHCGLCREDLVRCESCRHYDGSLCMHPQAASRYSLQTDAAKQCPLFRSRHAVNSPHSKRALPAPVWVTILLLVLVTTLVLLARVLDVQRPIRVVKNIPAQVTVGRPFTASLQLINQQSQPSDTIYIKFDKPFLLSAYAGLPTPQPVSYGNTQDGGLLFEYPSLPVGGSLTIHFPFIPQRSGPVSFTASVFLPNDQLVQVISERVVVKDSVPALSQKEGPPHERGRQNASPGAST